MSVTHHDYLLTTPARRSGPGFHSSNRPQSRCGWWVALATVLLVTLACPGFVAESRGAIIFVTTTQQKISSSGGCSLQEAIYSANFDNNIAIDSVSPDGTDHFISTQCVPGSGDDRIILPSGAVFQMGSIVPDAHNPFGPTATPMVTSNIIIEANGSLLQWVTGSNARIFSVASTGNLTIRNAYIKGFSAKGGDGADGGGGGMGAGGAIYVKGSGSLTVENSTFEGNRAVGGNGSDFKGGRPFFFPGAGGGGGGLSGNGGHRGADDGGGGGGGGSRGRGADGAEKCCVRNDTSNGGGGGGTLFSGLLDKGGVQCGGDGEKTHGITDNWDGADASCPGGGGGGGGFEFSNSIQGHGGMGAYGGGGGGGSTFDNATINDTGDGGDGGFGGGGGASNDDSTSVFGPRGGNGGFGGGGGASDNTAPGNGGAFAGKATDFCGGGGAALGGAIFSDGGVVRVQNSTFTSNSVDRGTGGCPGTDNGADAGGAIFSLNGTLTVLNSTISGNQSTGSAGGVEVFQTNDSPTRFSLHNTIIANNGATECLIQLSSFNGKGFFVDNSGNLIKSPDSDCPGVVAGFDPQLGPLQLNGGITPTMAIPKTSPAFNAADSATSLASDQRGVDRPQAGGFDIGAYELCVPRIIGEVPCMRLVIQQPPETRPLIIQASPAAGGTVTPPSGDYTLSSVVVLTATPNNGYSFVNWTGAVADPGNPSTTVTMDQPQTVIANFVPLPTTMLGNIIAKSTIRVWTLSVVNNGPGVANGTAITSFMLTQTFGAACTPVIGTAFPLAVGNLAPMQTGTANVTIDFTGCATTARFTSRFTFSANSGAVAGSVLRYNQFQ